MADFGLGKLLDVSEATQQYLMTGETGSYRYMAPEVFLHKAYDKSVDVFSFAVIVHELFEVVHIRSFKGPRTLLISELKKERGQLSLQTRILQR